MVVAEKASRGRQSMAEFSAQTARTIGARLRSIRAGQGVRLVELGEKSGVDIATISRIETGKMTGTLECHIKLATALGVKVTELYAGIEEERTKGAVTVQPQSARADVYVHESGKFSTTLLTSDVLHKQMMPVLVTIEPGGHTPQEEAKVGSERFVYVLEGAIEARVGDQKYEVKRGSSLYLDASVPHQLHNAGQGAAKCLSVITPPML